MLAHLAGLAFFDPALVGGRVRYLSFLRPLEEGGIEGLLEALGRAVREQGATLLVVDGPAPPRRWPPPASPSAASSTGCRPAPR
jgi:hypothetical protein